MARAKAPAENGFWHILNATERSFLYLYDKIWGGQFALASSLLEILGDLSPPPWSMPMIVMHTTRSLTMACGCRRLILIHSRQRPRQRPLHLVAPVTVEQSDQHTTLCDSVMTPCDSVPSHPAAVFVCLSVWLEVLPTDDIVPTSETASVPMQHVLTADKFVICKQSGGSWQFVKEGSSPTIHYLHSFTNIPGVKIKGIFWKISKVCGIVLSTSPSPSVIQCKVCNLSCNRWTAAIVLCVGWLCSFYHSAQLFVVNDFYNVYRLIVVHQSQSVFAVFYETFSVSCRTFCKVKY